MFVCLWLLWVFAAARGLSLVAANESCSLVVVHRPLTEVASLVSGLRLEGARASVVAAHGFSCSKARGIFPYQGSNPCLLHQQADSQPVDHQGSAGVAFNCGELMNVNMTGPRPLYFHSKLLLFLLLSFPLPWTTWSLGK